MRPTVTTLILAALLAGSAPALAQTEPSGAPRPDAPQTQENRGANPDEAEQRGLTAPEVQRSLMPNPTPQGTRPPEPTEKNAEPVRSGLYQALNAVRRAPPGLDGHPIPRPNTFASEPGTEMEPDPAGNPENLFPENYVE